MSVQFQGREYLVGPALLSSRIGREYDDIGRAFYANQNCTVLRNERNPDDLLLKVQYLNSNFPTLHPIRTQPHLLRNWS